MTKWEKVKRRNLKRLTPRQYKPTQPVNLCNYKIKDTHDMVLYFVNLEAEQATITLPVELPVYVPAAQRTRRVSLFGLLHKLAL